MPLFDPETGKLIDRDALKSVKFGNVYHGDWNPATGTYTSGVKDMTNQLKHQSDNMSERMGFEVNYQLADPGDKKTLGVTDDQ